MNINTHYILRVDSPDQPGIVAAVAGCLHAENYNIEDASQFSDKSSGRFSMRVVFRPMEAACGGAARFRAAFAAIAGPLGLDWDIHDAAEKVRTLVMVSRADHCLHDILYRVRTDHLPLDIAAVVSNHETCRPLALQHGLRYEHMAVTDATRQAQEDKLAALAAETGAELIVLARYMQILSDGFCRRHAGRIINIHHSFLPGFKGARPYHQAWARGVKLIGATAHFATPDLDEGPIIEQDTVRIDHALTPERLQVLGRDIEAQVLARALLYFAERRIFLHGHRTVIL